MFHKLLTHPQQQRYIHQIKSNPNPKKSLKKNKNRTQTHVNTENYKRSLRRSFARSKLLAFFNPDLTKFVTLTYAKNHTDIKQTQTHVNQFFKYQKQAIIKHNKTHKNQKPPLKYIYIYEYQKRGALHLHLLTNSSLIQYTNDNEHQSVAYWTHGFTSVLDIDQTDHNFRPYLYLFKYMHKTQRIGASFIHTSRNFIEPTEVDHRDYINILERANLLHQEDTEFYIQRKKQTVSKKFYTNEKEPQERRL